MSLFRKRQLSAQPVETGSIYARQKSTGHFLSTQTIVDCFRLQTWWKRSCLIQLRRQLKLTILKPTFCLVRTCLLALQWRKSERLARLPVKQLSVNSYVVLDWMFYWIGSSWDVIVSCRSFMIVCLLLVLIVPAVVTVIDKNRSLESLSTGLPSSLHNKSL